jgi:hypothetical protein
MNKPWFLRSKKLGDYSHLRRKEFNELREMVSDAVREYADSSWKKIKTAALVALADLAKKHRCTFRFNAEGGHICIYKDGVPVFALRIGNYSRHRVEDLLKGKALYRGIVDIVPSTLLPLPKDLSPGDGEHALVWREMMQALESLKVLYFLLPTIKAGKWRNKEAFDMVDVIECIKAHPGSTRSDIQHTLNLSPNKTVRLLDWLRRRQILRHRGSDKNSGWYLN